MFFAKMFAKTHFTGCSPLKKHYIVFHAVIYIPTYYLVIVPSIKYDLPLEDQIHNYIFDEHTSKM